MGYAGHPDTSASVECWTSGRETAGDNLKKPSCPRERPRTPGPGLSYRWCLACEGCSLVEWQKSMYASCRVPQLQYIGSSELWDGKPML